jgi:hypothetical protein
MKLDPISSAQRDTILRQIKARGKWKRKRNNITVRMWKQQTPFGLWIAYQVLLRPHVSVHGIAGTVTGAIAAVNEVLQPSPSESIPAIPDPPSKVRPFEKLNLKEPERLPYKDA